MQAERSAGSAGREASSEEQSERDAEGQVSSAKQFATGARSTVLSEEQSNANAEAESAELRSVPQGTIRGQHGAGNAGNGAIRARRGMPSIERGAICERCEALKC
jgi:hypothetical protein